MSRVYLDRAVYTTITAMSVLIVYVGWQNLKRAAAVRSSSAQCSPWSSRTSSQHPRAASRAEKASRRQ